MVEDVHLAVLRIPGIFEEARLVDRCEVQALSGITYNASHLRTRRRKPHVHIQKSQHYNTEYTERTTMQRMASPFAWKKPDEVSPSIVHTDPSSPAASASGNHNSASQPPEPIETKKGRKKTLSVLSRKLHIPNGLTYYHFLKYWVPDFDVLELLYEQTQLVDFRTISR
jgi:hypothetical protein